MAGRSERVTQFVVGMMNFGGLSQLNKWVDYCCGCNSWLSQSSTAVLVLRDPSHQGPPPV